VTPRQLADLFRAERRRFARHFPELAGAQLFLGARPRRAPHRAFAFVENVSGLAPRMVFYREALTLPRRNVLGLMRHELGHAAHFATAGYAITRPGAEQRADDIAEAVTGTPIRYETVGRARAVQSVGRGAWPRPCYLHR
jgi:hypothetical protein